MSGTRAQAGSRTSSPRRRHLRRARTCRVQDGRQLRHAASEPGADDVEALERRDVAFLSRPGDDGARDHLGLAGGEPEHVLRHRGRSLGEFLGLQDQRVPAGGLLPAPLEAAPAPPPVGRDVDVPDLRGDAEPATQQPLASWMSRGPGRVSVQHARAQGIADLLRRSALRHPAKLALVSGEVRWSFAELDEAVNRTACALSVRRVEQGQRVAVLSHNCWQYAMLNFALARLGAVMVPINFMLGADEIAFVLEHSGASGFIVEDSLPSGRAECARRGRHGRRRTRLDRPGGAAGAARVGRTSPTGRSTLTTGHRR